MPSVTHQKIFARSARPKPNWRSRPFTDCKARTVEHVWLDDIHGLRISVRGHDGRWPVSTIKFIEKDTP